MANRVKSLHESLVKSGLLTESQVKEMVAESRTCGETLIKSILKKGVVDENSLAIFLEKEMGFPRVGLSSYLVDQKTVDLIPITVVKKHKIMPLFKVGEVLSVAMVDPFDIVALDEVRAACSCEVEPMVATPKDIEQAINQYYGLAGSVEDLIKSITPEEEKKKEAAPQIDEAPVAKLVNLMIYRAVVERASDIHIDPTPKEVRVRYRLDGILQDASTAPLYLHSSIVNRIKIMGALDIAESRVPQDGRFELKVETKTVDVRVSSFPSMYGEALVLRLLDKSSVLIGLEEIGFSSENLKKFEEIIKRPYGIILVTGPTGSGKTTTLYATLNHIVTPERNIMTIEDPIEYELYGVRQSQVNVRAGLEFSTALRSILRQDPDVILVGEIRDIETSRVAVQAALTGHLVFSTLHTNDAAGTLTRLTDMGVEPFLTASSMVAAIAQRLVRTICAECKTPFNPPRELLGLVGLEAKKDQVFYKGKGCKHCRNTGYRGRTAIFEVLLVDDVIRDMIIKRASSTEIKQAAITRGMKTLHQDGLLKVLEGKTTLEEVLRVTQLD